MNMRATVEGLETASQAAYFDTANSDQGRGIVLRAAGPGLGASILVSFARPMPPASPGTKLHVVSAAVER
jgi:hypothetical protein